MRPETHRSAAAIVLTMAFLAVASPAASQAPAAGVRAADTAGRELLAEAVTRSPTIAELVRRLEASDVVVFVTVSFMQHVHGDTGLMAAEGGWRYLLVRVDVLTPRDEQIILLGHELQHAVEIATRPDVQDAASLTRALEQIGWGSPRTRRFETEAAVRIGRQVRDELGKSREARR